jgi:hypothetical protein
VSWARQLATGERVDRPLREVEDASHRHHALDERAPLGVARAPAPAVRVAAVLDHLADRHPARSHARLRQQRQTGGEHARRQLVHGGAVGERHRARERAMQTGERAQERGLPAPVGPDQRGHAAAVQADVDAVDDDRAAIRDVHVARLQLDPGGHRIRVP